MRKSNVKLPYVYDGANEWDSDVNKTAKIVLEPAKDEKKTGTNVKYKDTFFVFTGQELGEKLICWWMNYINKILKKQGLSWDDKIDVLKQMVNKEAESIVVQVLKDTVSTNVVNHKWEYRIGKNKMENLRNDTTLFSYTMKNDNSIERKIQAWCEGKEATVVKDKNDNNRKILEIPDAVNNDILNE